MKGLNPNKPELFEVIFSWGRVSLQDDININLYTF